MSGSATPPSLSRMTAEPSWMPLLDPPGMDLRPAPDAIATTADLVQALRLYHQWAGNASMRDLSFRCRHRLSASAFSVMLQAFLTACGVHDDYRVRFELAWRRVAMNARRDG